MTSFSAPSSCFSRFSDRLFESYFQLVYRRPLLITVVTVAISCFLSAVGIYFNYNTIDFNPSKGFETRGTELSQGRLILDRLRDISAAPLDIYKSRNRVKRENRDAIETLLEEELEAALDDHLQENSTYDPITVNYDEYGVDSEPNMSDLNDPCTEYNAIGKKIPHDVVELMAKFIVEANDLFSVRSFMALCEVDEIVGKIIDDTRVTKARISQLKHSINLPLISTCMNLTSLKRCSSLNHKDVLHLRETIERCRRTENSSDICGLEMIQQASQLLLPIDLSSPFVSVLLPLQRAFDSETIYFFEQVEKTLAKHFSDYGVKLKGVDFGTKKKKFQDALFHDAILSTVSATLVLATFYLYSGSFIFTIVILAMVFLSMTLAFFTYTVILGIDFFPFLNLLVIVLMTSIGADDAFLLLSYYKLERKRYSSPWKPGDIYLPTGSLHSRCLQNSLKHSLMSMFITSATTAVAFLSNLSSDIVVLRCFGIYACLTVMFNLTLVVFILPATIMLTQSDRDPLALSLPTTRFMDILAKAVHSIKWIIALFGIALTVCCTYVTFVNPGLRLPEYNPTKLLVDNSRPEWFDNNAHLFNFEWKRSYSIQKYFLFDKIQIRGNNMLSVTNKGDLKINHIRFSAKQLENLEKAVTIILNQSGQKSENSWIAGFGSENCSAVNPVENTCYVDHYFERLPSAFPEDFSKYPSDGPLFNKDLSLIGYAHALSIRSATLSYFLSTTSKVKLTAASRKVSEAFDEIKKDCETLKNYLEEIPFRCLSSSEITRYYDIIERLWPSTLSSVFISVLISLIVVILCTQQFVLSLITVTVICAVVLWTTSALILLGWQLSVVESTIIVLTIGLSFDFSLHIAASVKESREQYMIDKIRSAFNSAGTACSLAACSSVVCGLPLLFASTAAFNQVGVMLITLGVLSLFGALIMLPTCLLCLSIERKTTVLKL